MSGLPPILNQENLYRSEVAGIQMAAEANKEEVLAKEKIEKSQKFYQEKLEKTQEVKRTEALKRDSRENHQPKEKPSGKSLNGGSLLDTIAE